MWHKAIGTASLPALTPHEIADVVRARARLKDFSREELADLFVRRYCAVSPPPREQDVRWLRFQCLSLTDEQLMVRATWPQSILRAVARAIDRRSRWYYYRVRALRWALVVLWAAAGAWVLAWMLRPT